MALTPAGSLAMAQHNLRVTLADCPTFRSLVGVDSQSRALSRIYNDALPLPLTGSEHTLVELESFRPFALVWTPMEGGFGRKLVSAYSTVDYGVLMLRIEQDVASQVSEVHPEVYQRFVNVIGQIIDELTGFSGMAGYLAITQIEVQTGPVRSHPDDYATIGDIQFCDLRINWGVTA